MTEGTEYILALKDEMSSPAAKAKGALSHLKDQLKLTEQSIKSLKDAQQRFKASGLKDEVKASGDAIAKMRDKASDLKGSIKDTAAQVKELDGGVKESGESMMGAALSAVGLNSALDVGKDIFRKIGEAAKWAAEQLVHWTIEAAKVAIEAGAARERLVALYDYFGAGKGQEIFTKLDALGTAIHVPTEKVHEYAKDLIQSGIEGQNRIEQTVKSVAMLQKVAGDDAANKIKGLIEESAKTQKTQFWKGGRGTFTVTREQLVGTGVTIDQVFAALAKRTKLGVGQVRMQMMMGQITAAQGIDALNDVLERGKVGETARNMTGDLTQAFTELKDNIGKILRDVDYKGFVKELSGFAKLFDPLQASGKTTKAVMVGVFNTIFDVAKKTIHAVRIGVLDLEIAGLRLLIFLGPQIKQFKKLWGEMKNNAAIAMVLSVAWNELKGMFVLAAFSLKGLMVFINGSMVALDLLGKSVQKVMTIGQDIANSLNMKVLGSQLMTDLIAGVREQLGAVKGAAHEVGGSIKDGFKDAIGWHSPPKFFTDAGKASKEAYRDAASEDGGVPMLGKMPTPRLQAGGGGGNTITVQVDVEITGVKGAEEAVDMFRAKMTDVLEQIADELGGKVTA